MITVTKSITFETGTRETSILFAVWDKKKATKALLSVLSQLARSAVLPIVTETGLQQGDAAFIYYTW